MVAAKQPLVARTAQDVERDFPEAVAFAKAMREVFGDGVKITYARNANGDVLRIRRQPN